jgi:hypothetical protein
MIVYLGFFMLSFYSIQPKQVGFKAPEFALH